MHKNGKYKCAIDHWVGGRYITPIKLQCQNNQRALQVFYKTKGLGRRVACEPRIESMVLYKGRYIYHTYKIAVSK